MATAVPRVKLARLKATFIRGCLRTNTSASPLPMMRAAMSSQGETKNRPMVTGISLIENEWALRPMCRWMTMLSTARNSRASSGRASRSSMPVENSALSVSSPATRAMASTTSAVTRP